MTAGQSLATGQTNASVQAKRTVLKLMSTSLRRMKYARRTRCRIFSYYPHASARKVDNGN
jgi:hypothetical protein